MNSSNNSSSNNNNSSSNNNSNNNNSSKDLFLSIWRNNYLKNQILNGFTDIRLKEEYCRYKQFTVEELRDLKNSGYLYYVHLIDDELNRDIRYIEPSLIPEETIELVVDLNKEIRDNSFASKHQLKRIKFTNNYQRSLNNNIPTSVERVTLLGDYHFEQVNLNYLSNLKYIDFGNGFNGILEPHSLPHGLLELKFGKLYDQELSRKVLPKTLQSITFGEAYNKSIFDTSKNKSIFPNSLKRLYFGLKFDLEIKENYLNDELEELVLGDYWNQKELILNKKLKKLKFGLYHNKNEFIEKNRQHNSLIELEFGNSFDKSIDKLSSSFKNLKYLKMGYCFNQPIKELPSSIESLHLGFSYSQSLEFLNDLSQLEHLTISKNYNQIIKYNTILNLSNLKELNFSNDYNQSLVIFNNKSASSLLSSSPKPSKPSDTSTSTSSAVSTLPTSKMNEKEFKSLLKINKFQLFKSKLYLNNSQIRSINFGNSFNKRIEKLWLLDSNSLQEIHIGTSFNNQIPKNSLPPQLKRLIFSTSSHFNQNILKESLPDSIEELQLGHQFNRDVNISNLPRSLKILKLLGQFNKPFDGGLPESLEYLEVGVCFNQEIKVNQLNKGLQTLIMGQDYNNNKVQVQEGVLPNSITYLRFQSYVDLASNSLPSNLNKLLLSELNFNNLKSNFLPKSLKWFELNFYNLNYDHQNNNNSNSNSSGNKDESASSSSTNNNNSNHNNNNNHHHSSSNNNNSNKEYYLNEGLNIFKINNIRYNSINNLKSIYYPSSLQKVILLSYKNENIVDINQSEFNLPKYCNLIIINK